ncbi:hypothetical protein GEU84_017880 [Fertoebacter nigrum]|uniref:Uncharacterized protein n=1 Tax=Fertoeibacter niger TaxID=2656921 RepID=A0A8X8KPN4_9RHOB|nr:hypothetical protein [Fertoeibacter niger]NUB46265.1 hypothetical protein [Fertoeibacter niger]
MTHALPLPRTEPQSDTGLTELLRQAMAGFLPSAGLNALLDRMERRA